MKPKKVARDVTGAKMVAKAIEREVKAKEKREMGIWNRDWGEGRAVKQRSWASNGRRGETRPHIKQSERNA